MYHFFLILIYAVSGTYNLRQSVNLPVRQFDISPLIRSVDSVRQSVSPSVRQSVDYTKPLDWHLDEIGGRRVEGTS